ncbi:hypothetical protein BGZ65_011583, partial [Modicella reniformis]
AQGFYEALCQPLPGYFDVYDHNGGAITGVGKVTNPAENKRAVIGGFLDLDRVDRICSDHDLVFVGRNGYPVISQIDKRRKDRRPQNKNNWHEEYARSGKSIQGVELEASVASMDVSKLEKDVKGIKKEIDGLTREKKSLAATGPQVNVLRDEDKLWLTKQELRNKQMQFLDLDKKLRSRRSEKYHLNMMAKAARSHASGEGKDSNSNNNNNSTSTSNSSNSNNNNSSSASNSSNSNNNNNN